MYFIYTLFLLAGLMISAPYYLIRFRRYAPTLADRFGMLRIPKLRHSVWVHAVSVGEVKAVGKLLERLRAAFPDRPLVVSTVTPAGQQLAREQTGVDYTFFFPFDLPWTVRRALDHLDPEIVIIAETEIWPNFVRACRERGIQVMMVNGRIADRSLPRYRLIRGWLKDVFDSYIVLGMQSDIDRQRIQWIGADSAKVIVFGNLKYDALTTVKELSPDLVSSLSSRQPLWIAASTAAGEEEFILDAFATLLRGRADLKLMIAPRHPERFDEVESLILRKGLACQRRTRLNADSPHAPILLLDTIGELDSAFEYAAVVFMGGTLVPQGGHNILEPARFSKPIVFGPHMENFREISQLFLDGHAAIQIQAPGELAAAVNRLLTDRALATSLGNSARKILEQNTGATERVMRFLRPADLRSADLLP